jgi:hypothetical protein
VDRVDDVGLIALASLLQPSMATAMAIASLLPAVMVTPLVSSRVVLRLLVASGLVGAWSVLVATLLPGTSRVARTRPSRRSPS